MEISNKYTLLNFDNSRRKPGVMHLSNNPGYILIKGFHTNNYVDIAHVSDPDTPLQYYSWMDQSLLQMRSLWSIYWDYESDDDNLPDIPLYLRI